MIWYGMVWYGMVWYGMVRYNMVRNGMVYNVLCHVMVLTSLQPMIPEQAQHVVEYISILSVHSPEDVIYYRSLRSSSTLLHNERKLR